MGELNVATVTRQPEVLLVDSQDAILQRLHQLLSAHSYVLHLAHDASEALKVMATREVDLIISAAHLPQMDGPSLLARIHQHYPDTTRILLTGDPDLKLIAKAINEGEIYRYLSKPWDDQELLLTLRQALEHQHSVRERQRLEAHLSGCNGCAAFLAGLKSVLPLTVESDDLPASFWERYSREIQAKLSATDQKSSWWGRFVLFLPPWPVPVLATALVLILVVALTFTKGKWRSEEFLAEEEALLEILPLAENLEFFRTMEVLDTMDLLEAGGGV